MDPVLIDKLVTIRMNKKFMEFVQENVYKGDILLILVLMIKLMK